MHKSPESRRYFAWWRGIVLALEALGAVSIVVYALLINAPAWLPVVFIGVAVVLSAIAPIVGSMLRRHEESRDSGEQPWTPISRREIVRKITIVAITFVAVFVIGILLLTILTLENARVTTGARLTFSSDFALIAAALACILVTLPLNRRLRGGVDRDLGRLRKMGKVVLGRKKLELDHDEQVAAAEYAVLMSIILPFQAAYIVLLYLGIGIQQLQLITSGNGSTFSVGLILALVVVLVAFFPLFARRIYRARKYAKDHEGLLPTDDAAASDTNSAP